MNAKTFVASSSREALRKVRAELGEEAIILSNRKTGNGVEIVAAPQEFLAERPPAAVSVAKEPGHGSQTGLLGEIRTLHEGLLKQLMLFTTGQERRGDHQKARIQRSLVKAGFSVALANQILDQMPEQVGLDWVLQVLERNLRRVAGDDEVVNRGGVYALVGPTGVGKTTTTAKLAARAVLRHGPEHVAMVTTDSYRVGAFEQLRIYGKILGIPVLSVRDASDLQLTLSSLGQKRVIFVDTMGVGQRDSRVEAQSVMLDQAGVKRLLLLNATSHLHTLEDVVRVYRGSGLMGCILTKRDEAVSMGGVLDVVIRHKLVMHYVADGQRVPEDLHDVSLSTLLRSTFSSLDTATHVAAGHALDFPQAGGVRHAF